MEIFCIVYMIFGIIFTLIGFIATIICFACPVEHIWTVPLLLIGILFIYTSGTELIDIKVEEELNNRIIYENIITEEGR